MHTLHVHIYLRSVRTPVAAAAVNETGTHGADTLRGTTPTNHTSWDGGRCRCSVRSHRSRGSRLTCSVQNTALTCETEQNIIDFSIDIPVDAGVMESTASGAGDAAQAACPLPRRGTDRLC